MERAKPPKFRKEALDFLHSPDELAQTIQVVSKKGWIALIAIYGLLIGLIIWGFLGTIPTRIAANGILLLEEGTKENQEEMEAIVFLPVIDGQSVQPNMSALVVLKALEKEESGSLKGSVMSVSPFPLNQDSLKSLLPKEVLSQEFHIEDNPILIRIRLEKNKNAETGYQWTTNKQPDIKIVPGMLIEAKITLKEQSPISLIIPNFKKMFRDL